MHQPPRASFVGAAIVVSTSLALAQHKPGELPLTKPSFRPRPAGLAVAPSASAPQFVVSTAPPGTTTTLTSATNSTGLALPDTSTVSQTLVVSGAGTSLWDVDLTTSITHAWCSDLDITLTAPSGKRVSITTDNGGDLSDVFDGTLWDDSAPDSVNAYPHVDNVTSPALTAEGAFSSLIGDDPNGTWTLTITDDGFGDVGNLSSWTLDVWTLNGVAPPVTSPTVFTSSPSLSITDFNTISDSVAVSGLGSAIAEVRVYTEITHTWSGDIDMWLDSPGGTSVDLTSLNGGGADNVFDGTNWYDTARSGTLDLPASNVVYTNNVTAANLVPDGAFGRFFGENPNGTWQLWIHDNSGGDSGTLHRWDLSLRTYSTPPPPPPINYCTSGTTTHGCVPSVTASANPSVTQATTCVLSITGVEGQKSGIVFYGLVPSAVAWAAGSNSFLCVKPPTQRTGGQSSGGTVDACNGLLVLAWDAYQLAHPTGLGTPWLVGSKAYVQGWFRDPPAPKTTNLSDGIELVYQP